MITISHEAHYIYVAVLNEFTVQDFKEFEDSVLYELRFHGSANLLFDLSGMMGYTIDMAVEEVRFARKHRRDFGRVAIVSDDQWVTWSAWINNLLSDAEIEVFDDVDEAKTWLEVSSFDTETK
ncbi:STAS/SEC14 domain-containing protein [Jeongeupia sp. USM3]|uniref:STAS/SEC14 domain-containing protein n=1 Tax=Jeongeupia sp. USM3 TaxID=1906741 RepID=UPI00089DF6BD|nr:STAS/SEC14 domain-containing protein [Jeongeupia sp. USM3]AOX99088.1 STAS/SEC14 domain-containing protein [Jeongeupia sp. USM3]